MYKPSYFACLLMLLTDSVLTEICNQFVFVRLNDVDEYGQLHSSLLDSLRKETLNDCMKHMILNPKLLWFLYEREKKECVTSQCWGVQLSEPIKPTQVLYRKRVSVPRSCSDVKAASPNAEDGEYWIYPDAPTFLECPTKIYCHGMTTAAPSEFVTLAVTNTGEYPNKSNPHCTGEGPLMGDGTGKEGTNHFNKIKVNINDMTVDRSNYTFAIGAGKKHPYATAEDCYSTSDRACGPVGTFDIDTSQTGIVVSLQIIASLISQQFTTRHGQVGRICTRQPWTPHGYNPHMPSVTRSGNGQQIHLRCGGMCGRCEPTGGNLQLNMDTQEVLPHDSAHFITPQ